MNHCLYSAEQVREFDRLAIEEFAIPSYELMCKAGQVLLDIVQLRWSGLKNILIVCGSGNNAGDGYVLARLLGSDCCVDVYSSMEPEKLLGDAKRAYNDYQSSCSKPVLHARPNLNHYDLIVDALFGSGLCRDVEGRFADLIKSINDAKLPILAVDVPSGLNATTGSICGVAIKASVTATFIAHKRGLLTNDGQDCSGFVFVDDLDVPNTVFDTVTNPIRLIDHSALTSIARRPHNAHKGSFGSVLLLGANIGMEGAIALAGQACLKSGAGLVKVAGRSGIGAMQAMPDLMRMDATDIVSLEPVLKTMSVLGVGPGLGTDKWAVSCFELVRSSNLPKVLDADALNILALLSKPISGPLIITPHPAEAARLLSCTTKEVQSDRFKAVLELANRYKAVVVLKGSGTLISDGHEVFLCHLGNPSMSCAGMGDVLTGVISSLLAQGLSAFDAAKAGVYLHAHAGDLAKHDLGSGLTASDVMNYLPKAFLP